MSTTRQDRKCSPAFSRTVDGAPDTTRRVVLYQALNPISE